MVGDEMVSDSFKSGATTAPNELSGPLPRTLYLTGNGRQIAAVAALLFALSLVGALLTVIDTNRQLRDRDALRQDGIETTAAITRLWFPGRGLHLKVSYIFIVNGVSFAGEAQAPRQLFDRLNEVHSLPVRYLATNPAVNYPTTWEWSVQQKLNSFFAVVLLAAFGMILLVPLYMERKLVAEAAPTVGLVTNCASNRKGGFSVKYQFRLQDGSILMGSGWSPNRQENGAAIWVLYLVQNPRRNTPYPSLNYRVGQ
jgi:hypothetical protein